MSLSVDEILHESTIYGRREKLIRMTDGLELGDVYGATIERIKAQAGDKSRLGMAALMWISHAERPLEADELCHALAVKPGSTDFNNENVPLISTLVSCCQGLITVDKEESTVRLIHFILHEYLSTHPDAFSRPHSAMAEICLAYLIPDRIEPFRPLLLLVPGAPSFYHTVQYTGESMRKGSSRTMRYHLRWSYSRRIMARCRPSCFWGGRQIWIFGDFIPALRSMDYIAHRSSELLKLWLL